MSAPTILYHASCLDGFGAAYAAWRHFGDGARYCAMAHGQPWRREDVAEREVHILDFSFPRPSLEAMAGLAASVSLLDHHQSARREWAEFLPAGEPGLHSHLSPSLPLTVSFDLGKSGARLAWERFLPNEPVPPAIAHIEDHDLWRQALPGTAAFCRALRLAPFEFSAWDEIIRATADPDSPRYRAMLAEGEAIERFCTLEATRLANSRAVSPARLRGDPVDPLQAVRHGRETLDDGEQSWLAVHGLAVNASPLFASQVGQLLADKCGSFGMVWQIAHGEAKVSLRGNGRVNVAAIAERYGGGGHPNAAGFRLPAVQFLNDILR